MQHKYISRNHEYLHTHIEEVVMLNTMIGYIQKIYDDISKPVTYGTELEAYIVSKNPQNTYDVEAFARDFESKHKITIVHNEIFADLLCIIPIQFAAYFLSVHKGYNPDQPRNLAKVVTVE